MIKHLPDQEAGRPISASWLNAVKNMMPMWIMRMIRGGPGIAVKWVAGGIVIENTRGPGPIPVGGSAAFLAKITGSSNEPHAWTEQQALSSNDYQALPNGRSGTTSVDPAYEVNGREDVPAGTIVWLTPIITSTGVRRYVFDLGAGTGNNAAGSPVSPKDLRVTTEGAESADSATWAIESQTTTRGVRLRQISRVVYNDAGDEILYGFYRDWTFDANGHLVAVGAETRYTIDTPTECP